MTDKNAESGVMSELTIQPKLKYAEALPIADFAYRPIE
jgi:hypothetical protein